MNLFWASGICFTISLLCWRAANMVNSDYGDGLSGSAHFAFSLMAIVFFVLAIIALIGALA